MRHGRAASRSSDAEGGAQGCLCSDPISLFLNRTEIGDYLGLSIETVSRAFGKLRKSGLIKVINNGEHFVIVDPPKLRQTDSA